MAQAPQPAPVTPPPAARPSNAPAEVTDFIPEDVDSSFGGATGDLWADDGSDELPAVGGGAPVDDESPELATPSQSSTQVRSSSRTAPAARPAPSRAGERPPRGGSKPPAIQPAFEPKTVSSDTPQGKAFAELVALFPGKVIEVVPLRQAADTGDESDAQSATEAAFADGYDDPTGAELDNDDA